jgi:fibronectin type 3 domain-containing protein
MVRAFSPTCETLFDLMSRLDRFVFLLLAALLVAGLAACDSSSEDPPPPAPTGISATAEDGAVTLDWTPPNGEEVDGYNVYRSTGSFSDPGSAQQITGSLVNGTDYRDADVENETTYYYRVSAVKASGDESELSGEASATPADRTPPAAPSELSGTSEDGAVALEWNAPSASDLSGHRVYRSESSFSDPDAATRANDDGLVSGTSYTDDGAANGTTYYYRVAAVDDAGNESTLSGEAQKTPFPDPPDEP